MYEQHISNLACVYIIVKSHKNSQIIAKIITVNIFFPLCCHSTVIVRDVIVRNIYYLILQFTFDLD